MRMVTLYLPEPYIKALERMVNAGYYPNRAEAIRTAVRALMKEHNEFLNSIVIKPIIDNTESNTENLPKKERRKAYIYTREKP